MVSVRGSDSHLARPLMGISDRPSDPCKFRTGVCASFYWTLVFFTNEVMPKNDIVSDLLISSD